MKKSDNKISNSKLRKKAEHLLKTRTTKADYSLTESDALKHIHELELHEIELELQNEELRLAKNELTSVSKKYTDLYNYAPNGYFTLAKKGEIMELNLNGAKLLGKKKSELINSHFGFFVQHNSKHDFNLFLQKVFKRLTRENAEIIISNKKNQDSYIYLTGIAGKNRDQCSVTAVDITEKKLAEELLKSSKKRFVDLVKLLPEAVFEMDANFNLTYVNRQAMDLFGYSEAELTTGLKALEMIAPEEREKAKINFAKRAKGEEPGTVEYMALKKDGSLFPIQFHASSIVKDGQLLGARGVIIDISERKRAEQELVASEEKFKNIFNNSVVGKSITDLNGGMTVNKAFSQIVGYSQEELNQMKWQEFTHSDDIEKNQEITRSIVSGKIKTARWEKRYIHKKGHTVWVDISTTLQLDTAGQPQFFITSAVDITERKLAEDNLKEYKELFSLFMQHSPVYTFIKEVSETQSRFIQASDNYKDMVGLPVSEMIGKTMEELFPPEFAEKITADDLAAVKEGKVVQVDENFNYRNYTTIKFPLTMGDKKLLAGYTIDITDRKKAEKEIIEAKEKAQESDRLKSAFLANMSHEIRTPMNGILGFTNLLQDPELTGEEQQEYIGIIQKSGDRMLNTVNDIINISKIEAGQMTVLISEFSIDEQLKTIYSFFKPETDKKGIQFILKNSLTEQDAVIESDKEKIHSILTNLVKNAIKFCDKGKIELGCLKKENGLQIYVKDSGIGIPLNRQQAIFERFIQADIEDKNALQGSGLGLAISKSFVEMLGGKIWVESEEGKGSTFFFTIPYKT